MKRKRIGANQSLHRSVRKVQRHERVQAAVSKSSRPVAAVLVIALALGAATWISAKAWTKAAKMTSLQFRGVELDGANILDSASVVQAAGLTLPCAFTQLNRRAMEKKIESLPWVLRAELDPQWMRKKIRIVVRERQPVAWIAADSVFLADAEGRILPVPLGRWFDLPVISGISAGAVHSGNVSSAEAWKQARSVFDLLQAEEREIAPMISEVLYEKERLTLFTISGIRVQLPLAKVQERLSKATFLIRTLTMAGRTNSDVNLCYDRVAYVR